MRHLLLSVILGSLSVSAGTVFTREKAGAIWQDGLFIGDGRTGAMAYAPSGLEWTINRNDVFDARVWRTAYEPHADVMACVATNDGHSVAYLGNLERARTQGYPDSGDKLTLSLSAAILKIRFWPWLVDAGRAADAAGARHSDWRAARGVDIAEDDAGGAVLRRAHDAGRGRPGGGGRSGRAGGRGGRIRGRAWREQRMVEGLLGEGGRARLSFPTTLWTRSGTIPCTRSRRSSAARRCRP